MYQPQVCLDTGAVVGAEALVRWQHPQLGLVPPMKFVPTAERSSIIETLTLQVLRMALRQISVWNGLGMELDVSVNLSAAVIDRKGMVEKISGCIAEFGVNPIRLCFEVTETGIMRCPAHAEQTLQGLSALGSRISIDDFGTGYCSLKYLRNFPVDEIKIDRLFVAGLLGEKRDGVIVESILALGKAFDIRVVAEGIENEATRKRLMALGCRFGQGFHLGKPVDADQFELWRGNGLRRPPVRFTAGEAAPKYRASSR